MRSPTAPHSPPPANCQRHSSALPNRPRRQAFSLVELIVVVMIMGIFTAVTAPKFIDSLVFYRVECAARRVKSDLEWARQAARLNSASQSISFVNQTYTMSAGVTALNSSTGPYAVDLSAAPYSLNNVVVNFGGTNSVTFNGYGVPTSGGTVVLTGPKHQCTVTVDGTTGQMSITRVSAGNRTTE